jgi:hypothetical protein
MGEECNWWMNYNPIPETEMSLNYKLWRIYYIYFIVADKIKVLEILKPNYKQMWAEIIKTQNYIGW